jgi:hypothetical protein
MNQKTSVTRTVEAERFVLRDASGAVRAVLATSGKKAYLRFNLRAPKNGRGVEVGIDPVDRPYITLERPLEGSSRLTASPAIKLFFKGDTANLEFTAPGKTEVEAEDKIVRAETRIALSTYLDGESHLMLKGVSPILNDVDLSSWNGLKLTGDRGSASLGERGLIVSDAGTQSMAKFGIRRLDPAPELYFSWKHDSRVDLGLSHAGFPRLLLYGKRKPPGDDLPMKTVELDASPRLVLYDNGRFDKHEDKASTPHGTDYTHYLPITRLVLGSTALEDPKTGRVDQHSPASLVMFNREGKATYTAP